MSQSTVDLTPKTGLPGVRIVTNIRRLVIVAALAAFAYGAFLTGSKGYCPGGMNSDDEFLDANGNVTEVAPTCIDLVLRPSDWVWFRMIPITEWDGTGTIFAPFPFGSIDVAITPGATV